MDKTRKESIIRYVDVIKNTVGSSDPIDIANYFEYKVSYLEDEQKEVLTAKTTKYKNKNIILINKAYPIRGRMVLCAHELGHIITGCILGLKIDKIEIIPIGLRANFKT